MVSTEGTIGWDESLTNELKNNEIETQVKDEITTNTKEDESDKKQVPKPDANDYSRFDKIGQDEDDEKKKKIECRNCAKDGASLKCSVCKKVSYCSRHCQKDDWPYHKRICKKDKKDEPKRPSEFASKPKPPKPRVSEKVVVDDEEDLKDIRGYTKEGLPYFHREQTETEKKLIGDIAPKRIESTSNTTPSNAPVPIKIENKNNGNASSAWNHAGTFEERDYSKWAQDYIKRVMHPLQVPIDSIETQLETTSFDSFDGHASICVVRGTKRFIYDFEFTLKWEIPHEDKKYKGKLHCRDISNDGDYEFIRSWDSSHKPVGAVLSLLEDVVNQRSMGLQQKIQEQIQLFYNEFQNL